MMESQTDLLGKGVEECGCKRKYTGSGIDVFEAAG
jgi:hypothetical protein